MTTAPTILTPPKTGQTVGGILLPYQVAWIGDESPLKLGDKSRRTGWTWCEAYDAVSRRWRKTNPRNVDYWFSSADESAAMEFIEYCDFFARRLFGAIADRFTMEIEDPATKRVATAFCIRCPNNTKIVAMSSNPRRFRSKGGDVRLDEADFHDDPEGMWDAASPVTQWGGSLAIWSTPNGVGRIYNRWVEGCKKILRALGVTDFADRKSFPSYAAVRAKARELRITPVFSYHRVTILDAIAQGLVEKINSVTGASLSREAFLEGCRDKSRSDEAFLQEFMCQPSEDATAWLDYALIRSCEDDTCPQPGEPLTGYTGGPLYVGIDVGRKHDLTVIWILEKVGDVHWTRQIVVFDNMTIPDQTRRTIALLKGLPRWLRCCIDLGSFGRSIAEYAQEAFGMLRVEGVDFTQKSKAVMATGIKEAHQDRKVRTPPNDRIREGLHKIKKVVTAAGNERFDAPRDNDGHADEFWSLALALHADSEVVAGFQGVAGRSRPKFGRSRSKTIVRAFN